MRSGPTFYAGRERFNSCEQATGRSARRSLAPRGALARHTACSKEGVTALSVFIILIVLPAGVGWLVSSGHFSLNRHFLRRRLQPGVPIVYRMAESSTRPPGPEARDVRPAERGDFYYYLIKKYWRVEQVLGDGRIVAVTPLMEHHVLRRDDPNLRKANLLEQLRYGARFPRLV